MSNQRKKTNQQMAKSKNWTMEDIVKKGITEVEPGIFRSSNHVSNTPSLFVVKGIVHGLNGSNGLLRSHWTKRNRIRGIRKSAKRCRRRIRPLNIIIRIK